MIDAAPRHPAPAHGFHRRHPFGLRPPAARTATLPLRRHADSGSRPDGVDPVPAPPAGSPPTEHGPAAGGAATSRRNPPAKGQLGDKTPDAEKPSA